VLIFLHIIYIHRLSIPRMISIIAPLACVCFAGALSKTIANKRTFVCQHTVSIIYYTHDVWVCALYAYTARISHFTQVVQALIVRCWPWTGRRKKIINVIIISDPTTNLETRPFLFLQVANACTPVLALIASVIVSISSTTSIVVRHMRYSNKRYA
jgi:hypothetical protein